MSKAEKQKQEKLKERLDDQKPSDAAVPPAPKEKKQKKDKREKATKIDAESFKGKMTIDNKNITMSVIDEGVLIVITKGAKPQERELCLIRWPFVVAVFVDDNAAQTLVIYYARKDNTDVIEDTQPRPSDPDSFTNPKFPALKLRKLEICCESADLAQRWAQHLKLILKNQGHLENQHLVVYINPFSGKKTALKTWKLVRPVFELNNWKITETVTQRPGHCKDDIATMDLTGVDHLATVSGDGLLNELLNGLMSRKDWLEAIKIPLGIIPSGSGNAMATALGAPTPLAGALAILKNYRQPTDMLAFYQRSSPSSPWRLTGFGFEALMWALVSDIDIESEALRCLGPPRLVVGTIKRILALRKYPAKLYLLPHETQQLEVCQFPLPCDHCTPPAPTDSIECDEGKMKKKKKKKQPDNAFIAEGRVKGLPAVITIDPTSDEEQAQVSNWEVVDGTFIYFVAANITHISTDVKSSPFAHFCDGAIDVAYTTKSETGKMKLLSVFADELESGKYVRHPMVKYRKVRALVLVPTVKAGIMDLDGEPYPGHPSALEIYPGVLTFCRAHYTMKISNKKYCVTNN